MTYPQRGEMSDDGKFYTHTDGSVFSVNKSDTCGECFLRDECNLAKHFTGCRFAKCTVVAGAYVPSDEEQEACDMARAAIQHCSTRYYWSRPMDIRTCEHNLNHCHSCSCLTAKSCPARAYLAVHGATDAWEVTP